LSAFRSPKEAAGIGFAGVGFGCLSALAAQFLYSRTDGGEIIGGTGAGHVSSSNLTEPLKGSHWLVVWLGPVAAAAPSRTSGPDASQNSPTTKLPNLHTTVQAT
jgi:hypothetical protein